MNIKPTQGFNVSGKFEDRTTKSTISFGANNKNAHAAAIAKSLLGKVSLLIRLSAILMDSFMTAMFQPEANETEGEMRFLEWCFLLAITTGPALFLGWTWCIYVLLPILIFLNIIRPSKLQ